MSKAKSANPARRFKWLIDQTSKLTRETAAHAQLSAGQVALSQWQCDRLAETYGDFYVKRRFRPALDFFLTDIYGPTDFSQRDSDILRVYPVMVKMLTAAAIESLTMAVELHALSTQLDQTLLRALVDDLGFDPHADELTADLYAEAYRLCDNHSDRVHQIELAIGAAELLENAVKHKMLYVTVKVARRPAKMAGFGELQSFIERGLSAFKHMKGAQPFIQALAERERFVLDRIYDGDTAEAWLGDATHHISPP